MRSTLGCMVVSLRIFGFLVTGSMSTCRNALSTSKCLSFACPFLITFVDGFPFKSMCCCGGKFGGEITNDGEWRHTRKLRASYAAYLEELVVVFVVLEQDPPSVKFKQRGCQRPHVDGVVIVHPQSDLRGAIESGL